MSLSPLTATALAAALAGVGVLRWGWRRAGLAHLLSLWIGWGGAVLAGASFAAAVGAETGLAFALLAVMGAGLLAIAAQVRVRPGRETTARMEPADLIEPKARRKRTLRGAVRVVAATLFAAFGALGAGALIAATAPVEGVNAAALGALAIPPLWGGGMAWALGDDKLVRPVLGMAGLGAAGFALVFWI